MWYGIVNYMQIIQAIILGAVQGITEFLPISSDGHLILIRKIFNFTDQGLDFDIVLHLGTLLAIIIYFGKDWIKILKELREKRNLFWQIIIATIPAALAGVFLEDLVGGFFRSIIWTAIFFIICGVFLMLAELCFSTSSRLHRDSARNITSTNKNLEKLTWRDSLFIGILQIFALLPGISRSGMTIGAGMIRGLSRSDSARFSFLMATIIVAGAGFLGSVDAFKTGVLNNFMTESIAGFVSAAIVGYLAISFLMKFLKNHKLYGFAGYLIILGMAVLIWQLVKI